MIKLFKKLYSLWRKHKENRNLGFISDKILSLDNVDFENHFANEFVNMSRL